MSSLLEKDFNDDERLEGKPGLISVLIFLFVFVLFVYGALFVALLGISDWIIHAQHLSFFLKLGNFGVVLLALSLVLAWALVVFTLAGLVYYIFLSIGKRRLAERWGLVVIFSLFHIFAFPWILWPIIRNASPALRYRHRQKLRLLAKGPKMQERLKERGFIKAGKESG